VAAVIDQRQLRQAAAPLSRRVADAYADVTDIGDTSYSAVLVDDLDNDGQLELLVTTMSGHVYSFGTPGEYHPLKTWPQPVPGQANFVARHDMVRAQRLLMLASGLSSTRASSWGLLISWQRSPDYAHLADLCAVCRLASTRWLRHARLRTCGG
jgi:hypothetical protein